MDPRVRLTAKDEARLVAEMRAGSQAARDALCAAMLPLVYSLAHRYAGPTLGVDDLAQEGQIALLAAIASHDPSRGRLAAYAAARIRGAMLDAMEAETWRQQPWESGVDEDTPADALERAELAERASAALTGYERGVLELRARGLSWRDVARQLGISAVHARQIGSRARRRAREILSG